MNRELFSSLIRGDVMWIQNTRIGLRRFFGISILLLIFVSYLYIMLNILFAYGIVLFGAYIAYIFYLIRAHGITVRKKSFVVNGTPHEVRYYFYFSSPKQNMRAITCGPNNDYFSSSILINAHGCWKFLSFLPQLLQKKSKSSALVLGVGGCAVPYLLLQDHLCDAVDAVEKYSQMIAIAKKYMLPTPIPDGLHFICDDALRFVKKSEKKYDFIFIDLFEGLTIMNATDGKFIKGVSKLLQKDGLLIVNLGFTHLTNISQLHILYSQYFPKFAIYLMHKNLIGINQQIARLHNEK